MPLFGRLADAGSRKRLVLGGSAASAAYALGLAWAGTPGTPVGGLSAAGGAFAAIAVGFSAMDIGVVAAATSYELAFALASLAVVAGALVVAVGVPAKTERRRSPRRRYRTVETALGIHRPLGGISRPR